MSGEKGFLIPGFALACLSIPLLQTKQGIPWWVWLILIILLIILLYPIFRGSKKSTATAVQETIEPLQEPAKPDDLTVIEGIGPKINQLLHDAGYHTYAQLANADMSQIDTLLRNANLRLADPSTWAEQAQLAANGEWDALETLQGALKGGRRE